MHRATTIRERIKASQAKRFGFCTCTPSATRKSATAVVSADTKTPRICTFHSYFNFNPFNRCALAPPISFSSCRYKKRGRGLRSVARSPWRPLGNVSDTVRSKQAPPSFSAGLSLVADHWPLATSHCFSNPFRLHTCIMTPGGVPPRRLLGQVRRFPLLGGEAEESVRVNRQHRLAFSAMGRMLYFFGEGE